MNEAPIYLLIYMIKLLTNEILLTWAFLVLPIMFIFILLLLRYSLLIFKYIKKKKVIRSGWVNNVPSSVFINTEYYNNEMNNNSVFVVGGKFLQHIISYNQGTKNR